MCYASLAFFQARIHNDRLVIGPVNARDDILLNVPMAGCKNVIQTAAKGRESVLCLLSADESAVLQGRGERHIVRVEIAHEENRSILIPGKKLSEELQLRCTAGLIQTAMSHPGRDAFPAPLENSLQQRPLLALRWQRDDLDAFEGIFGEQGISVMSVAERDGWGKSEVILQSFCQKVRLIAVFAVLMDFLQAYDVRLQLRQCVSHLGKTFSPPEIAATVDVVTDCSQHVGSRFDVTCAFLLVWTIFPVV